MNDFNSIKENFSGEIFSEGAFEIIIENKVVEQTSAFILNNGVMICQNLAAVEMAVFGMDGVEDCQMLFSNKNGKFPCFFDENVNSFVAVIPGVKLSEVFENSITEIMNVIEDEKELISFGITRNEWEKYIDAKPKSISKNKP